MRSFNLVLGFMLVMLLAMTTSLMAQNNCLEFDGTQYVTADGVATTLAGSSTLTMEAWFNSDDVAPSMILAFNDAGSGNIIQLYIETTSKKLKLAGSTIPTGATGSVLTANTWYHVAVTLDASNNLKAYLNGIEDISTTMTDRPNNGDRFSIGQEWDDTTAGNFFNGKIDEVRVWSTARTQTNIRQCMYREIGIEGIMVSYYKFNETSGTTLYDATENDNDGTLTNMTGSEWQTSPAVFGPKNCLDFDGTDDYVDCGSKPLSSSSITLECWVNVDAFQSSTPYISSLIGSESDGNTVLLRLGDGHLTEGNKAQFVLYFGSAQVKLDGTTELVTDTWYHIAGVYSDGSGMKLYINGKLDASNDQSGSFISNTNFCIASNDGTDRYLDGSIDEVRVWSDARTATEIREYMCKNIGCAESGLTAYYSCDYFTDNKLPDYNSDGEGTVSGNTSTVSSSAFNTWLNTSSTSWSTASNWSGGIPSSGANVGIYNLTNEPNISASQTFGNLYLGSGISTTLSASMTVNGSLILDKVLDLNGQTITLEASANLVESTGNLYGSSGTIQTTRSLSNIDEDVAGLGAEIKASGDLGSTTIIRGHTAQGSQGIERYYQITTTNSPSNDTLVFNYLDSELNGQTENELELFKSSDGSTWLEQSASVVNTGANTLTLTGINAFSYWTAAPAGSDASLPVELSSFTVENHSGSVLLNWCTESEIENLGFIIQRKIAVGANHDLPSEWSQIASYIDNKTLEGHGSTTEKNEYQYTDKNIQPCATYEYRLGDVDYYGKVKWHKIVTITIEAEDAQIPKEFGLQRAYPNPFNPAVTLSYDLTDAGQTTLQVYNIRGQLVETLVDAYQQNASYSITWQPENLSTGVYIVRLQSDNKTNHQKIVFVK